MDRGPMTRCTRATPDSASGLAAATPLAYPVENTGFT